MVARWMLSVFTSVCQHCHYWIRETEGQAFYGLEALEKLKRDA